LTEKQLDYARSVADQLKTQDFRVTVDERSEKVGAKIRLAQMEKVPYMLILGPKEVEQGAVSVRSRASGDQGAMSLDSLIQKLKAEEIAKQV
jgi:threonyl-tRNA synthetase